MVWFIFIFVFAFLLIYGITSAPKKQKQSSPTKPKEQTYNPIYLLRLGEVKRRAEERGDTATVQAVLNMTYDGPLPKMKPDHTFVAEGSTVIEYSIAGINYRREISNYVGDLMGYIKPEPRNKYDPNAIAVHAFDGHHLGYIPADYTDDVRDLIQSSFPFPAWCDIAEDFDYDENRRYFRGTVYLEIPPNVYPSKS